MLMRVVSLWCKVAINYYSQLDGVPMHIPGQDESLHGSSPRTFLTEIFSPTFLTIITCVLRTCVEVIMHLIDIISHTSEVPCTEDDGRQNTHAIDGNRDSFFLLSHPATTRNCRGWPNTCKFSSMFEFMGDTTTLCGHLTLRIII
ncbi:hypothetical protein MKX03_002783 [Papaver bracteatum]|nr:hypothetical protein MKX03_002783 [Papaver bracteatum]